MGIKSLFPPRPPYPIRPRLGGFSLLELVLALAIFIGLLGLTFTGLAGLNRSLLLQSATQAVGDVLREGRAEARARGTPVEVRFYRVAAQPGVAPAYTALQLHVRASDGSMPPLGFVTRLPTGLAFDPAPDRSSLLGPERSPSETNSTLDRQLDSDTRAFRFLPAGTTDLPADSIWFITIRSVPASSDSKTWACLQVDPGSGRVTIYRP